ncbi:hypothetical protein MB818_05710 [Ruegeria sp. 1NDH52C]|uniref:Uracil DNA glycosylase superfamily protein n=1 Tax=Ruegeria alba TaxID=2916756 RepID=A0ABS9NTY4_9RHOB|nr:hypothetical protein [Ruegeria alba]MCG6557685.1 hypothetical protein [Ruegeria alba]
MDQKPANHFLPLIAAMSPAELEHEIERPSKLQMQQVQHGRSRIDIAYAPFDHVNSGALLAIVGITPGRQQMGNALRECHKHLRAGVDGITALAAAKVFASFSGPMRANLVAMLDEIGVHRLIGVESTASLWTDRSDLAHFTSALRYPVFVDGKNYSGAPDMTRVPVMREQLDTFLADELRALPKAIFVPLGPKVSAALEMAADRAGIDRTRILSGLPHPSGANAERIAYLLGRKPRAKLSSKTNPDKIDAARASITRKIRNMEA